MQSSPAVQPIAPALNAVLDTERLDIGPDMPVQRRQAVDRQRIPFVVAEGRQGRERPPPGNVQ